MAERERIRDAIEGPVNTATKLLAESRSADLETRLTMLVDGWGRGLAAGLEELAVSLSELRRTQNDDRSSDSSATPAPAPGEQSHQEGERSQPEGEPSQEAEGRDAVNEKGLQARAAASREATAQLRDTTSTDEEPNPPADSEANQPAPEAEDADSDD